MQNGYGESPFNPVAPVVWAVLLPMIAIEVVLALGGMGFGGGDAASGWRSVAIGNFGFNAALFKEMMARHEWPIWDVVRILTYPFVHSGPVEALMAGVFIIALGKAVTEAFSAGAFLAIFFGSAIGGALIFGLMPGVTGWLTGGFTPAYGLIGAFTFILWVRLGQQRANPLRAFTLIGGIMVIQLVFAALFGASPTWFANIAGFVIGFGLSFLVAPGGPQAMLARIRRR